MAKTTTSQQQPGADWIPPRGLPPDQQQMRKLAAHEHMPQQMQELSRAFETFAHQLIDKLPDHPARTEALKSIVKARDMAMEALLPR